MSSHPRRRRAARPDAAERLEPRVMLAAFAGLVNFQPAAAPIPAGYAVDSGAVYADRGNGLAYGWDAAGVVTADRDDALSPDQRYDTLAHLSHRNTAGPPRVWEMAVPNGSYTVRLAAGDPTYTDSIHSFLVEGEIVTPGTPSADRRLLEAVATVQVSDGRLTVGQGPNGSNAKLAFIEVRDSTSVLRVNGGGASKAGLDGTTFVPSSSFVSGGANYVQANNPTISGPISPATNAIYQDEWTGGRQNGVAAGGVAFSYTLPAAADGDYLARLHFAELNKNGPGLRVFDVNLGGGRVELDKLDLFQQAGYRNATVRDFVAKVSGGSLKVDFVAQTENAKVSAIELIPLGPGDNAGLSQRLGTQGGVVNDYTAGGGGGNTDDRPAGTGVTGFIPLLSGETFDPLTNDGRNPADFVRDGDEFYTWRQNKGYDEDEGKAAGANDVTFRLTPEGHLHILGVPNAGQNEPFGYISTEDGYRNYHLSLEYKWGQEKFTPRQNLKRDSGLLYHAIGPDKIWTTDVETQIQEGDTGDFHFLWFQNSNPGQTRATVALAPGTNVYQPGGTPSVDRSQSVTKSQTVDTLTGWNRVEVIIEGDNVTAVVNGVVVNRATDMKFENGSALLPLTEGKIQLQAEGAEIFYRDIQIKPTHAVGGRGDYKVLVFQETAGFDHRGPGTIGAAEAAIRKLGASNGFGVDVANQSAGFFTDAKLAEYDAVIWNSTTGDVLDATEQAAFERYVRAGGGFVGLHAASDTEYQWPWFGQLVGAYFENHPNQQVATIRVDPEASIGAGGSGLLHPAVDSLPNEWRRFDEWYNFQSNPRGDVNVLLTLDESSYNEADGSDAADDHPISWWHDFEGGRSFYSGLGHRPETYTEPLYLTHLLGGIEYAAGVSRVAPADAVVLFGDGGLAAFEAKAGGPAGWVVNADSELEIVPGTGDVKTKQGFGDYRLHLEFKTPATAPGTPEQQRGNSGLFLAGSYELQILDSYGDADFGQNDLGAIYNASAPAINAALPAETWQIYDVTFTAARFDAAGNKVADARVTAYLNGVLVQDDVAVPGPTQGGMAEGPGLRPIVLQDHDANSRVKFRNIWVEPSAAAPAGADAELSPDRPRLLFNDPKGGTASPLQRVFLRNVGPEPLEVLGASIIGPDASRFAIGVPIQTGTVAPGNGASVGVRFDPPSEGVFGAFLEVRTNSARQPNVLIPLRGLGTDGLYGDLEPSLQYVLDTLQIPVNVADPNPATGPIENFFGARAGDEQVKIELLERAGDGPVTVVPLAVFSGEQSPDFRLGRHAPGDLAGRTEMFVVSTADDQTLNPFVFGGGTQSFTPDGPFALYTEWPAFDDRVVSTQNALNTFDAGKQKYAFYPLKDAADNLVPNAYVVGVEEATNDDFQDAVLVVTNVRPAADLRPGKIGGRVYEDLIGPRYPDNLTGFVDPGEPGLGGATLYLDANDNFERDADEPTTVSAADGTFEFAGVAPGFYRLAQLSPPAGFRLTGPDSAGWEIDLQPGQTRGGFTFVNRDDVAPRVASGAFDFEQGQSVTLTLSEDATDLFGGAGGYRLTNLTTGGTATLPTLETNVGDDPQAVRFAWTHSAANPTPALGDGNWRFEVVPENVVDDGGNAAEPYALDFFVLAADANRDRRVDLGDFLALRQNFGRRDDPPHSAADFDYDGKVDLGDFLVLRRQFGRSMPAPPPGLFGDAPVGDGDGEDDPAA